MNLLRRLKTLVQERWPLALVVLGLLLVLSPLWSNRQPDSAGSPAAEGNVLRLLSWEGYPPPALVRQFAEAEGIGVELGVLADADSIASALRNPERDRYDLVVLPLEQVASLLADEPQLQPLDLNRLATEPQPPLAEVAAAYGSAAGEVYAWPHVWGTSGLIVNRAAIDGAIDSYQDLCAPAYRDRVSYRPAFSSLVAAAYGLGLEPFEFLAANPEDAAGWEALLSHAYDALAACHENVSVYWRDRLEQVQGMLAGEVDLAEGWDWTAWTLQRQNPDFAYIAPAEGLLGWLDAFAIPADAENLDAAYAWIDFVSQPENAALVLQTTGTIPAVPLEADQLEADFQPLLTAIYGDVDLTQVRWLPPQTPALQQVTNTYVEQLTALATSR